MNRDKIIGQFLRSDKVLKRLRKSFSVVSIFIFMLPLLFNALPVFAVTTNDHELFDQPTEKATISYEVKEEKILWQLTVKKFGEREKSQLGFSFLSDNEKLELNWLDTTDSQKEEDRPYQITTEKELLEKKDNDQTELTLSFETKRVAKVSIQSTKWLENPSENEEKIKNILSQVDIAIVKDNQGTKTSESVNEFSETSESAPHFVSSSDSTATLETEASTDITEESKSQESSEIESDSTTLVSSEAQTSEQTNEIIEQAEENYIGPRKVNAKEYKNLAPIYEEQYFLPTTTNVRNHVGGNESNGWNNNKNSATDTYITYGGTGDSADFSIKKYAQETTEAGLFDVFLNIKGNEQRSFQPIDIVLVVDWSGSMTEKINGNITRIKAVQEGIEQFVEALDKNDKQIKENIRLGYVGYSLGINKTVGLKKFDEVKDEIKKSTTNNPNEGTFTQEGIKEAQEILTKDNKSNRKVLILLTDGVPTYSYKVTKTNENSNTMYATQFNYKQKDLPGSTSKFSSYSVDYEGRPFFGVGAQVKDTFVATIGEAMKAKQLGIEIHGLGIQLDKDGTYLTKEQVEAKMKQMVSSDENGKFYYENAKQASEISNYLIKKAIAISGTIKNGEVSDPIGDQYIYVDKSLSVKTINNSTGVVLPTATYSNNTLNVSNINLSKNQEIEISYRVRLDIESKYFVSDHWYPMNGTTTLTPNSDNPSNEVEFAVPYGKGKGKNFNLTVSKIWEDNENQGGTRQPIRLQLQKSENRTSWKNVEDKYLEVEGPGTKDFSIPTKQGSKPLYYRVIEQVKDGDGWKEGTIPGYQVSGLDTDVSEESSNKKLTVTNKLMLTNIEFKKVASDGITPLAGVGFTLLKVDEETIIEKEVKSDEEGQVKFTTELPVGQYIIRETSPLPGFKQSYEDKKVAIEVGKDNKLIVTGLEQGLFINTLKPFSLIVTKNNQFGYAVQKELGAEFTLKKEGVATFERTLKPDDGTENLFTFSDLKPGSYELSESKTPTNHVGLTEPIKFTIKANGDVTFDNKYNPIVTLTPATGEETVNKIEVTIVNTAKGQLPQTGNNTPNQARPLILLALFNLVGYSLLGFYQLRKREEEA